MHFELTARRPQRPMRSVRGGFLKSWKLSDTGCHIDGVMTSAKTIGEVDLGTRLLVRIGIKDDAEHQGGFNLFGRKFGNYEHDLLVRLELQD